jgi:hypothetical protein
MKDRILLIPDNPVAVKKLSEYLDWEESRPDPAQPKPPPLTKEEAEERQRLRVTTVAQLESLTIWSATDIAHYLDKERHWVHKNVISKLDYHIIIGKVPYYSKQDILNTLLSLRVPTDLRRLKSKIRKT